MTQYLPELIALTLGGALTLYVLLGGADFGGGVWDLLASGPRKNRQRDLIAHAIGPIWEANHVWLVFALMILFTAFPPAFSNYLIALHVPVTIALVGIVLRGSSFVFRTYAIDPSRVQVYRWGRVFATASTVTPFLLGTCVGALAAERVHLVDGLPVRGFIGSWLSPFPLTVGLLAVALFSLLAAVYLTLEAREEALREDFRRRALLAAVGTGAVAGFAALFSRTQAPRVWQVLVSVSYALPFHVATGVCAVGTIWALLVRRFAFARILVALQASFILWGWFASQYPYFIVPDLSISSAAAPERTLQIMLMVTVVGAVIVFPSFYILYRTFNKFRKVSGER